MAIFHSQVRNYRRAMEFPNSIYIQSIYPLIYLARDSRVHIVSHVNQMIFPSTLCEHGIIVPIKNVYHISLSNSRFLNSLPMKSISGCWFRPSEKYKSIGMTISNIWNTCSKPRTSISMNKRELVEVLLVHGQKYISFRQAPATLVTVVSLAQVLLVSLRLVEVKEVSVEELCVTWGHVRSRSEAAGNEMV